MRASGPVIVVVVLGMLTACSPTYTQSQTDTGNIVLIATRIPGGFPDAAIEGTLIWSDAGCLTLAGQEDEYLLVMPIGTRIASDHELQLDDGTSERIGSTIAWSGGYYPAHDEESGELAERLEGLPGGCITDAIAVVNRFTETR